MEAWCVTSGVSFMQNVNDRLHFTGNLPHFYYRIARTTDPVSENRPKKLVKRQEWGANFDMVYPSCVVKRHLLSFPVELPWRRQTTN